MAVGAGTAAPWYLRLGAWIGIGTGPGALITGAGIAAVTRGWATVGAVFLGSLALTGLAVANGARAQRRRTPAIELAARALGSARGPSAVAFAIFIGVSCWTGFYIGIAARAVGSYVGMPGPAAAVLIAAALWLVYRAGFQRWNLLVALTGAAAIAVAVLTYAGVPAGGAGTTEGLSRGGEMLLGAGFVVAYAAVFAVRAPDFTWDAHRGRDVLYAGATLVATLSFFLGLGASVYERAGSWDFATLVNETAYPGAAVALLVLSIIAPSVSGLHSGGLSLDHLRGWPRAVGALVVAVAAAVLAAASLDLRLMPFLGLLGAVFPPVLAVMLLRTDRNRDRDAWLAWGAGATVAALAWGADVRAHVVLGIAVSGMLVAALGRTRSLGRSRP